MVTYVLPHSSRNGQQKLLTQSIDPVNYGIAHQLSGRLRLRIPRLARDEHYSKVLQQSILKNRAITYVRVNAAASSLTVHYLPEKITERKILDYLDTAIQSATQPTEQKVKILTNSSPNPDQPFGLPLFSLALALITTPLELPLWITGGIILAASAPLWQRVQQSLSVKSQLTVDCLDSLWLSAQLIQGNVFASALAVNFYSFAENLRQSKLDQLQLELEVLWSQKNHKIPGLLAEADQQRWIDSIKATNFIQQVEPIAQGAIAPTLGLSVAIAILTGDLNRASAILPLDVGVTLRGVTPLVIVSALTSAAAQGVYIADAQTLEQLTLDDQLNINDLLISHKIILDDCDQEALLITIALAKETFATAYQSLGIATVVNVITCVSGVLFGLDPTIAVLLNGGSAILAELNTLRLSEKTPKPETFPGYSAIKLPPKLLLEE